MRKIAISLIIITILFALSLELKAKELTLEDFYGTWKYSSSDCSKSMVIGPNKVIKRCDMSCGAYEIITYSIKNMFIENDHLMIEIIRVDRFFHDREDLISGDDTHSTFGFKLMDDGTIPGDGGYLKKISNKY